METGLFHYPPSLRDHSRADIRQERNRRDGSDADHEQRGSILFASEADEAARQADGEQEKFTGWISAMPPDQQPVVLFDVGDQDGILFMTRQLTDLLDSLHFPYTFTHAPGNHTTVYWGSHMAEYLKWLMPAY